MPIVNLTGPQMLKAGNVGCERQAWAAERQLEHGLGWDGTADAFGVGEWENHVQAAGAEYAAALLLGREWNPKGRGVEADRKGDIGDGLQVRWTKLEGGGLIAHDYDADEHYFILVRGLMPAMEVFGWLRGADAKQRRNWRPKMREPCYLTPDHELDRRLPDRRLRSAA